MSVKLDSKALDLILHLSSAFSSLDKQAELISFHPEHISFSNVKSFVKVSFSSNFNCKVRKDAFVKLLGKCRGKDVSLSLAPHHASQSLFVEAGKSRYEFFLVSDNETEPEDIPIHQESNDLTSLLWGEIRTFLKAYDTLSTYFLEGTVCAVALDDVSLLMYVPKGIEMELIKEFIPTPLTSKQASAIDKVLAYDSTVHLSYDSSRLFIRSNLVGITTPLSYKFPLIEDYEGYLTNFQSDLSGILGDLYSALKDVEVIMSAHDNYVKLLSVDGNLLLETYSPDIGRVSSTVKVEGLSRSFEVELRLNSLLGKLRFLTSVYSNYELQVNDGYLTMRFNETTWLILPTFQR